MESVIIDKARKQIKNLNILADELRLQLSLGKAEAKDLIREERKNIVSYIKKHRDIFQQEEMVQKESRMSFLRSLQNLESYLVDRMPDEVSEYDAYQKKILSCICELEEEIHDNASQFNLEVRRMVGEFKLRMDGFRVNLVLNGMHDTEKAKEIRNEFNLKLKELSLLLRKREEQEDNLEYFTKDISESFAYLKRAINDLR